jgi:hypothetical protein
MEPSMISRSRLAKEFERAALSGDLLQLRALRSRHAFSLTEHPYPMATLHWLASSAYAVNPVATLTYILAAALKRAAALWNARMAHTMLLPQYRTAYYRHHHHHAQDVDAAVMDLLARASHEASAYPTPLGLYTAGVYPAHHPQWDMVPYDIQAHEHPPEPDAPVPPQAPLCPGVDVHERMPIVHCAESPPPSPQPPPQKAGKRPRSPSPTPPPPRRSRRARTGVSRQFSLCKRCKAYECDCTRT